MAGSIINRGKNTWRLQVRAGSDSQGKPIRYSKTVHGSKRDAEKELSQFYIDCLDGKIEKSSSDTFMSIANLYLRTAKKLLKRSSYELINNYINNRLIPYFGTRKIKSIKKRDIQEYINTLEVSPRTIRSIFSSLSCVFNHAIDLDIIENNPCQNVRLPALIKSESRYLKEEEIPVFMTALEQLPINKINFKTAIYLGLFGGLRKGEILGLDEEDVNFDSNTVNINKSRLRANDTTVYISSTKTSSSTRIVSLPIAVMDTIRQNIIYNTEQRLKLGSSYVKSNALIKDDLGRPRDPSLFYKEFIRFLEKNHLPKITLHSLRHTHASMLAYMDTDKMQISKRLGHSQLSTTLNIYTHLFNNTDEVIASNLDNTYFKKENDTKVTP